MNGRTLNGTDADADVDRPFTFDKGVGWLGSRYSSQLYSCTTDSRGSEHRSLVLLACVHVFCGVWYKACMCACVFVEFGRRLAYVFVESVRRLACVHVFLWSLV